MIQKAVFRIINSLFIALLRNFRSFVLNSFKNFYSMEKLTILSFLLEAHVDTVVLGDFADVSLHAVADGYGAEYLVAV